ncbi:hypothetical protein AC792_12390 [Arthrobacter sp. RIT-PI-e]|uniref:DUF6297 family protein n=1 Tax=Arthrobacter sp. RIT-PI-e TaxID=1681197 RepID=UPI0006768271|nr:DUF6297 family protein [Arthrobacter sp. RIT-PI-e]KNC18474.1 hypothetical protein AC792_12390 [Arthrobacter sp. RIT-PI-e]
MTGSAADGRELARDLARFTRRSSRRHTRERTSVVDVVVDLYSTVLALACVLAVVVSFVLALREELVARSLAEGGLVDQQWQVLPQGVLWSGLTYLALVGVLITARKLGPVAVAQAEGAWWLPLPVDRRPVILPGFLRRVATVGVGASTLHVPFGLLTAGTRSLGAQLLAAATFGAGAVIAVGGAALLQLGYARGPGARVLGAVGLVPLALLPFLAHPVPLLVAVLGAGALVVYVGSRVATIPGAELVRGGAVSGRVGASLFFLDTNELARALAASARPAAAGRSARFYAGAVRGPFTALVRADVVAFLRVQPRPIGPLAWLLVCIAPVLVEPALPVLLNLAVIAVAGSATASGFGTVARRTAIVPELDALIPLAPSLVRCSRVLAPALAMSAWLGVLTAALALLGAAGPSLILLGATAGIGTGAGVVRAASRPPTDWTRPLLDTPFGPVPSEQLGTLLRGIDMTILALVPLLIALYLGDVTGVLLLAQLVASAIVVVVCAQD